jgi:hypothetical protein
MSKVISASDSEKSLENWNQLVTKRRGEYSARLKSAHRTSGNACLSWPTIECKNHIGYQVDSQGIKWPRLGSAVKREESNWPTPDASNHRDGEVLRKDNNLEQGGFHGVSLHHAMTKYGQAAPANPSTHGSRQELSWPTPQTMDTLPVRPVEEFAETNKTRGGRKNRKALSNLREAVHSPVYQASWRTPQANEAGARVETLYTKDGQPARPGERAYRKTPDGRMVLQSQTINQQVEMVQNWATPRTGATESSRPNNKGGIPLADQAKREHEKMWRTPSVAEEKNQNTSTQIYLQNQVGATPKAWATPIMGDSHLASTPEVAQKRIEEGKVTLSRQTAAWATPQLQDGHNINQDSTTHKTIPAQLTKMNMAGKLNPRWVETLMGLPVGWVMPSCKSPVTIEPTNCDSSATESCLPQPSELFAF